MSSLYRFLCLSHTPAIGVEGFETSSRDEAVGAAANLTESDDLAPHAHCKLIIGRYSYPLVEAYNVATGKWADADLLRLIAMASRAGVVGALVPFEHAGWSVDVVEALAAELRLDPKEGKRHA